MAQINFSGMKPLPSCCLLLLADTQGTSGGISSRSVLLPLGSFRLAVVFCHFSARVSPQFSFIPSMDYRNIPVFHYSARTPTFPCPIFLGSKKSHSMPRCTAPHAAQRSPHSLAMLSPCLTADLLAFPAG